MKLFFEDLEKIKNSGYKIANIIESKTCTVAKILYNNRIIAEYRTDMFTKERTITYSNPILECKKFIILDESVTNPDESTINEFIKKGVEFSEKMTNIDWVQNV